MTKKPVVSPAVEKAFHETWDDGTAWEGALAAIAQDRLERPFREEGPAQEAPCANAFYVRDEAHQALRDRAYVAIEVMKIEAWNPDVERVHVAATKALLEFLGQGGEAPEEEDDPDFADIEPAPKPPAEPYPWPDEKKPRPYQDDQGY